MGRCFGGSFPARTRACPRQKVRKRGTPLPPPGGSIPELGSEAGILARGRTYNFHKLPEM